MMRSISGRNWDFVDFPDWSAGWERVKSKLTSETAALVGVVLVTAALYGLVLISYYKALQTQTIVGF